MMKALLITLIVASVPSAALAQINQDATSCKAEDPDDATVSACTHLIETNELGPDDRAVAYCHRGAAYWRNGDYDKALADESKAIEINPEFADAYMTRGAFFVDTGDYDQAIAETSRAISIDPRNVRAYSNRAFARGRKGDFAGAIADTTKAIEIDPRWIAAYIVRGDNYARKGEHGMAFADFGKVAQIDPKSGEDRRLRGMAFVLKGEDDHAIAEYSHWIEMSPKSAPAYTARGEVYARKNDDDHAIADASKAIEASSKEASLSEIPASDPQELVVLKQQLDGALQEIETQRALNGKAEEAIEQSKIKIRELDATLKATQAELTEAKTAHSNGVDFPKSPTSKANGNGSLDLEDSKLATTDDITSSKTDGDELGAVIQGRVSPCDLRMNLACILCTLYPLYCS